MKKRNFKIVIAFVVSMVFLLSACGNQKKKTMTVSEMLDAVVEDNDGKAYIFFVRASSERKPGKSTRINNSYLYNGESIKSIKISGKDEEYNIALGEYVKGSNVKIEEKGDYKKATLDITTDSTGNHASIETLGDGTDLMFCSFSRIQIYDQSFMSFTTMYDGENHSSYFHVLIEDTASTKDKTIVLDPVGAKGVSVDEDPVADYFVVPSDREKE